MLTLEYDPERGEAIPDGVVDVIVDTWVSMFTHAVRVEVHEIYSTENIFFAVKCAIAEGILSHEKVQFQFKLFQFQANRYGAIWPRPPGFLEQTARYSERTVRAATDKRKSERGVQDV